MKMHFTSRKMLVITAMLLTFGATTMVGCGESTAATENAAETKATEKPVEKKWTEVLSLKGSGTRNSASFHLSGGKARVKYTYNAGDMGLFSFYVVPEGEEVMKDGGIPEVMTQESESTETYITKSAGNYYISVNSANGSWSLSVEEEK